MKRLMRVQVVAIMVGSFLLLHLAFAQITESDAAVTNIRKHLLSSSRRTNSQPLVFVGFIEALGPVFMGMCKEGVGQSVEFRIEGFVLGTFQGAELHTSYTNCTRMPLPPPFILHNRVIVYCEQVPSLKCLTPVKFSEQRLAKIKSWVGRPTAPTAARKLQQ